MIQSRRERSDALRACRGKVGNLWGGTERGRCGANGRRPAIAALRMGCLGALTSTNDCGAPPDVAGDFARTIVRSPRALALAASCSLILKPKPQDSNAAAFTALVLYVECGQEPCSILLEVHACLWGHGSTCLH